MLAAVALLVAMVGPLEPVSASAERVASARDRRDGAAAFRDGRYPRGNVKVGTVRTWPAYDYAGGFDYPKDFTLRDVGRRIEIWVASGDDGISTGTDYRPGDCRNGIETAITDEQVKHLVRQFDANIHPKVTGVFGSAPALDGTTALLPDLVPIPRDAFRGEGDNLVVLVDNIRGRGFYEPDVPPGKVGTPFGFYSSQFVKFTGRNVVTVNAISWLHRLGANPPDATQPGAYPCGDFPAWPHHVEAIIAHEYTHSLQHWLDPSEVAWITEGTADWVEWLTGYKDPRRLYPTPGYAPDQSCFTGYLSLQSPRSRVPCIGGGPANSLTRWRDQADADGDNVLADYGAAGSFVHLLAHRYGAEFVGALNRHPGDGLASLGALLDERAVGADVASLLRDWAALNALDGVIDGGASLAGGDPAAVSTPTTGSTVRWEAPGAYAAPGVMPNASDYVRLRGADGRFLHADEIESITFDGADVMAPAPVEWHVEPDGRAPDEAALHSGAGASLDRSIVREVTVQAADPVLRFATRYEIEAGYDYGFVQVSTDGGASYTSLPAVTTSSTPALDGLPELPHLVPGFTGDSHGWVAETVDLSAYADQTVLLAFRYYTDSFVDLEGWWVDDITVSGVPVGDGTLQGWRTATEIRPLPVGNWFLQLVAYTDDHRRAWRAVIPLDGQFRASISGAALQSAIGPEAQIVVAIVTHLDTDEKHKDPARYDLAVNGVLQPGG